MTTGNDGDWWRSAVVYQIYPRSFADDNADGIGDLAGIRSRLPYLSELGVDAIWLTPFYPSPLADGGYDVADYRDVDPRIGTLDDFDALLADAHAAGIKVLVDIVPNHTSDQHPWFRAALQAAPGSPERAMYIFRDGQGPDGAEPPADWTSHFGGPAWTRVSDGPSSPGQESPAPGSPGQGSSGQGSSGQWYSHLFAREQPDLNWDNPAVRDYFLGTLRFWADRGVDGFRVDVAHSLVKDLSEPLRSQPTLDTALPLDGSDPLYDRNELHELYRTWRQVFNEYDPPRMAVAETWSPSNARTFLYARPDELGQVFDFSLLKSGWGRAPIERVIRQSLADHGSAGAGGMTWVLSSHDVPRHASRLAVPDGITAEAWLLSSNTDPVIDPVVGLRRARAATLLMLALPGSAYLYQGEELGLPEVADLPAEVLQDPSYFRSGGQSKGRDGCRVPLPWESSGPSFGFGSGAAWLPQPALFGELSVAAQEGRPGSTLSMYREALALRRSLRPSESPDLEGAQGSGSADAVEIVESGDPDVLVLRRSNGWRSVTNFATSPRELPPGEVLLVSADLVDGRLAGESTAWLAP